MVEADAQNGRFLSVGMNIKNEHAERLTRQLANRTGENLTTAITVAVQERLARLDAADDDAVQERTERLLAIGRDIAVRLEGPFADTDHGDLLYDSRGLPR